MRRLLVAAAAALSLGLGAEAQAWHSASHGATPCEKGVTAFCESGGSTAAVSGAREGGRQQFIVNLGSRASAASATGTCAGGTQASATDSATCLAGGGRWTPTTAAQGASGVFEFNSIVQTAIPVILLITLLWAGLMITRRVIRSFRGA